MRYFFKALVKEAGMDAYVIDGYNRRDGALLPDPHEWCAAKVSGKWYMFDPTWGAGFVENYQFIPSRIIVSASCYRIHY